MSYDIESKNDGPFSLGRILETVQFLVLTVQARTVRCTGNPKLLWVTHWIKDGTGSLDPRMYLGPVGPTMGFVLPHPCTVWGLEP